MPVGVAVFVLSGAVIGYEILLMRLFSISLWHHFAYMIISLALLGFGASGTFVALARGWLLARFDGAFATAAALFGLTAVGGYALAQQVPFNPLEVVWDARQQLYLLELYLLLSIPFFCAATAIILALARSPDAIHLIYRFDLTGAGAGALAIIAALFVLPAALCLKLLGSAGFVAAALSCLARERRGLWHTGVLLAAAAALPALWPDASVRPRLSPFKELSQALRVPDARVIAERSSPLGLLSVVESPTVPFRHVPGMSLSADAEPPPQLGVFVDGGAFTPITRWDRERGSLAHLDFQSSALPYHLVERPRVLVLGAGGGADVLLALYHGAGAIDAVELNPQVVALVARDFADYAGNPYAAHGVRVHTAEARRFVARSAESYDVIQVALLDSFNASAAGVHALNESNLYTVEALEAFLAQLAPDGYLAITRWIKLPPRDALKLFATAVAALEGRGVARPAERLALIRSWKTATLLVKNGSMSATDIASITRFAEARGFDLAYAPGIQRSQVNRYNILERPYLFDGARALLGEDRGAFIADYKFDIAPATDDRPYFFHFFKWRSVPELLALGGRSGLPLVEWGYVVLIATLAQAALISAGLILLPLAVRRRQSPARGRARVFAYFLALGLGFLFIEMAFIQRMTLFLGHPLYAVAVVLGAFLVFAGLGSGYAARFAEHEAARARPPMALAAGAVALLAVLTLVLLPPLFDILQAAPASARIAVAIALIAPLAFCMGLPFPLGLAKLAAYAPEWVPWAWGINGCASVLSAVLATLLAIHFGFTVVVGLAALLYALAAGLPPRAPRTAS